MSNLNKKILLFVMLVGLTLGLVGCSNPENSVRIRFAEEEYELRLNETKVIEPTIIKSSQVDEVELAYSSSDESVVKVVDGVLVPVSMGEATVKVEWANRDIIFDKVTVRVTKASLPTAVLSYQTAMLKGAKQTVSVSLANNLTEATYAINALTPEVATVEGDVITAVAVGEAKFEVVVADYEEKETYEFTVEVEESDFAVIYNLDGGVNHAENPAGYNALELPLPLKEATKLGYTFLGWYHGEEKVEAVPAGTLGDYEVTAKWQIEEYTISYAGIEGAQFEAGYELPKAYTVESDEIVPAAPAKVGYEFLGWYAGEEKVEKIAKGSTGNVELVAEWKLLEYSISYTTAHGKLPGYAKVEDAIADFLADYNTARGKSHTAETFAALGSWGEISDASLFLYNEAYRAKWAWLVDYIATVAGSANAPAYKNFNKYNSQAELNAANSNYIYEVAYELRGWVGQFQYTKNANFKSGDYSDPAVSAAMFDFCGVAVKYTVESADIVLPVLSEAGYKFLGWYAGEDKVEVIAKGSTGNVELVAKWQIEEYTIKYTTAHGKLPGYATVEEAIADFLVDYNTARGKSHTAETFAALGSWGEISDASLFLYNEAYRAKWAWLVDYIATVAGSANAPAYKNFNKYNSQAELNAANSNYIYEIAYELRGWVGQFQYTKNANYKTADYSDPAVSAAMFDFCGLPATYTIESEDIVLPVLAEEGYVFLGWYIGETAVEKIAKGTTGNLEVVAKWRELVKYPMTWNLAGGQWEVGKEGPAEIVEGGFASFVLPTPVKKYCEFLGWYNAAGEKVEKLAEEKSYELTAKWEDLRIDGGTQYILFQLDEGNWKEGQIPGVDVTDYVEVLKLVPVKFGYKFAEWVVESDNDTNPVTVIYTAKWEKVEVYTVTYVLNGGENAKENPTQYTADVLPLELAPATKEGYKFLGWFDGETEVKAIAAGTTGNLTLEARWESTAVEVTFDLAGGEMEGNAPTYDEIAAEFLADFNKVAGKALTPADFFSGSSSPIKTVMANAEFLTKWAWFFEFAIEDLKAVYPTETNEYLVDVYPALEESLKGEYAIFTGTADVGGPNARTMFRNYVAGMLQKQKGDPSNTEFQQFATDFADAARQAALVAAAPQSYTFEFETGDALPVPTKEGYVFKGWYDANDQLVAVATASGTLKAKWEEEQVGPFAISYDLAGGQWAAAAPQTHEEIKALFLADMTEYLKSLGQKLEVIDPVDQPDHQTDFFGVSYNQKDQIPAFFLTHEVYSARWKWMYDYVLTVSGADFSNSTVVRSNIHGFVYATVKQGWPVSHDFSSVSINDYKDLIPAGLGTPKAGPAEYAYGVALELPTPVKEGATFAGWTLQGAAFEGITATTKGDLVLVATWK